VTEIPRRKRFQIHLSTAIVMMFVAGGLMWANSILSKLSFTLKGDSTATECIRGIIKENPASPMRIENVGRGYPFFISYEVQLYDVTGERTISSVESRNVVSEEFITAAAIDSTIALCVVVAVWFICEWLIRRRASRNARNERPQP
jgi:hypothetical protein